jgi:hypothetical protein
MSVTAATAAANTTATRGSFLTEKDVIIRISLHGILWKLHTSLRENVLLPGFNIFLDGNISNRSAPGNEYQ